MMLNSRISETKYSSIDKKVQLYSIVGVILQVVLSIGLACLNRFWLLENSEMAAAFQISVPKDTERLKIAISLTINFMRWMLLLT